MARRKKSNNADTATALERMQAVSAFVAACSNKELMAVFSKMPSGDRLYEIFVSAVNEEVETMFKGEGQEEVEAGIDNMHEKVELLGSDLEDFRNFVRSLNSERLFQVLSVIVKHFGITLPAPGEPPQAAPAPAPAPKPAAPVAKTETRKPTTLAKKFAASSSREVQQPVEQPAPQPVRESDNKPAAPTRPPRGSNIPGLF